MDYFLRQRVENTKAIFDIDINRLLDEVLKRSVLESTLREIFFAEAFNMEIDLPDAARDRNTLVFEIMFIMNNSFSVPPLQGDKIYSDSAIWLTYCFESKDDFSDPLNFDHWFSMQTGFKARGKEISDLRHSLLQALMICLSRIDLPLNQHPE